MSQRGILSAALALTLACGSKPQIEFFVADRTEIDATGEQVSFSWSTTGADKVELDDLAVVPVGSIQTLIVPPRAVSLRAISGSEVVTSTVEVRAQVTPVVSGVVLDANGLPVRQTGLKVGGVASSTDSQGRFTVSAVPTPFDVEVAGDNGETSVIVVGLRNPTPTVWLPTVQPNAASLLVSGDVRDREAPDGGETRVFVIGDGDAPSFMSTANAFSFSIAYAPNGTAGETLDVVALHQDLLPDGGWSLTEFGNIREIDATLAGSIDAGELWLDKVSSIRVDAPVVAPSGTTDLRYVPLLDLPSRRLVEAELPRPVLARLEGLIPLPMGVDSHVRISGRQQDTTGCQHRGSVHLIRPVQDVAAAASIVIPQIERPAPCPNASISEREKLSWEGGTGRTCVVSMQLGSRDLWLITSTGVVDLSRLHLAPLPRAVTWTLKCYGAEVGPIDEATTSTKASLIRRGRVQTVSTLEAMPIQVVP